MSSGFILRGISSPFALVGSAQADDVHRAGAWRKNKHVQAITKHSERLIPALGIVLAQIFEDQCSAPFERLTETECQAPFGLVLFAFGGVVGEQRSI